MLPNITQAETSERHDVASCGMHVDMDRDDITAALVANIQALMLRRGLNAHELASRAGLNPTGVYDIISGKSRSPKVENVAKIAKALGVRASQLLEPPTDDALKADLLGAFAQLPAEDQERLLTTARAWLAAKSRG
jgi:transcriptional regulator with XRE-family HTH domain